MNTHFAQLPTRLAMTVASSMLATMLFAPARAADAPVECGPLQEIGEVGGLADYRLKAVDSRVQAVLAQVDRYHTIPARRAIIETPTAHSVIADLDFTLRHSPNHAEALQLLLEYQHRGGVSHEFAPIECYFRWARQFAPTDISVVQLAAQFYWKSGNYAVAEDLYTQGLKAEPGSIELHYNAGLFYFDKKDYAKAREHARIAYAGGFPLPGLRSMLERVNQWKDPPETRAAHPNP